MSAVERAAIHRIDPSAWQRIALLLSGLVVGQCAVYGPSLVGSKILLPVDILAIHGMWLPPNTAKDVRTQQTVLMDLVTAAEPGRRFAAAEFRAGRVPLWDPASFAGAPFVAFGKYSPFNLLYYLWPVPQTLAYMQLCQALIAGLGFYFHLRHAIGVRFWPALVGAWCYPHTGFFVLWQGYPLIHVLVWLPWLLTCCYEAVQRPAGWGGLGIAFFTALVLLGGQLDISGQVLLVSGCYTLFCLLLTYWDRRFIVARVVVPSVGWLVGLLVAAPYVLPLLDYSGQGSRMDRRRAGYEERPPENPAVLVQVVLPDAYGTMNNDSYWMGPSGNQLESASAGYVGCFAALCLAPLAFLASEKRRLVIFWAAFSIFCLTWLAGVPGFVQFFRLPGLNVFSHNRLTFATGFGLLTLAMIGLDELFERVPAWRSWFWVPVVVLLLLFVGSLLETIFVPGAISDRILGAGRIPRNSELPQSVLEQVSRVVTSLQTIGVAGLLLTGSGLLFWFSLARRQMSWLGAGIAGAMLLECTLFARDHVVQCDPNLYFPRLEVFAALEKAEPGRVMGVSCLPSNFVAFAGFRDIRGYDAIDPRDLVELLDAVREPSNQAAPYAVTQWYVPRITAQDRKPQIPGILSMLGVRYLICRGHAPADAPLAFEGDDYWVLENRSSLPRAYLPKKLAPATRRIVAQLTDPGFDPRQLAYVQVSNKEPLPPVAEGSVAVEEVSPTEVTIHTELSSGGLVVLADRFDTDWHAEHAGEELPVFRVNQILRGVVVPAGHWNVRFHYEPTAFYRGIRVAIVGAVMFACWSLFFLYRWFASPGAV